VSIAATLYNDPACPWAYSESPSLRVLEWRYGEQLDWRLVLIGLTEDASQYVARGYTPLRGALGQLRFKRYGMAFAPAPKPRVSASARACRAVMAARSIAPGPEWRVFRVLQLANFTTPLVLDDDQQLEAVLAGVDGLDAELQGKTATTDGQVRFTAPSIAFERDGRRLVAGGFQPVEAYDVLIVNLDPTLHREPAPSTPAPLLERFPDGLTTPEVATLLTSGNDAPDRAGAEAALLELVASGGAVRTPLGDDALWRAAV